MIKKYQVTLFCADGRYKPVACIVNYEQKNNDDLTKEKSNRLKIQREGVIKICQKRYWSKADLIRFNFTKCKIRAVEN